MNSIACFLAREIGDEQVQRQCAVVGIQPLQELPRPEHFQYIRRQDLVLRLQVSDRSGECAQLASVGHRLRATASLKEYCRPAKHQQNQHDANLPHGLHECLAWSWFITSEMIRCAAIRSASDTRKINQPENSWKKPRALSASQYCTINPVRTMRAAFAATAIGIDKMTSSAPRLTFGSRK